MPTTQDLIDALTRRTAYPHCPSEVELVQTHLSLVFLAGERVYKVKKAVDLGFADYSTLERRRCFCEAEVRLNRRLAPEVYLGVVPITRDRDGSLRVGGSGETVEVAVEMRRLPARRMLDRLLEAGEVDNERIGAIAELLARFHAEAATGPGVDEHGTPEAVAFNVRENFEQTRGEGTLSRELHAFLGDSAERFLVEQRDLLERRVREGCIREGHGDLHAGNICLTDDGIVVYDCVEFAPRLRCGDVACDLAFLAMDIDYRGLRGFSRYLVRDYAARAGDAELERLIPFYKSYRAIVRGKVASLACVEPALPPDERARKRLEAMRYFHLAASYELPPVLILTCGLPASGKSTAARGLAEPFEAVVLRSDARRKHIAGLAPTEHARADFGAGIYGPAATRRVYDELREGARTALSGGRSVVVDATFSRASQRAPFLELARALGAPAIVVETEAPEAAIRERMTRRAQDRDEVSDADYDVYLDMRRSFEPPDEVPDRQLLRVTPADAAEEATARAVDLLIGQAC